MKCRCGVVYTPVPNTKRLCPACTARWKQRRAHTADSAKCQCGNVLGLERLALGIKRCSACARSAVNQERQRKLAEFADRYL